MTLKLEQKLIKKYNKFFNKEFYFECADGWYNLLDKTFKLFTEVESDDLIIFQIKEKFGGLRIYTGPANQDIFRIIDDAEDESFKICEYCGSTENVILHGDHWYKTLCKNCIK